MAHPTATTLASTDGVQLQVLVWEPPGEPRAVARIAHGMGEHALRYAPLAERLAEAGYVVYAQDHRGHGASATSADELGVIGADGWTELVDDLGRVGDLATSEHPGLKHALIAHSMGSFAAQQYLLDHSADVDAVVLTGTAVLDLLEPALDLDQPLDLTMFNAAFQPPRTEFDWLSRDDTEVDKYVADPLCGFGLDGEAGKQMFVAARRVGQPGALDGIREDLPVLIAVGELDPVNGQLALVHPLVDRLSDAGLEDVTLKVYPGARHEILNETNRAEVLDDVLGWLDERI
ncbi:alpha/beta hydrolase [Nocardioides halotolerans]|uniref:alpha/beta hydrolase n=1 Tax=Nocardioides halotolerans TaxID=433660 RepID=UPI0003F614AA|nr:alpha/beta hydrolase [Nocardioides halotolerans]